MSTTLAGPPSSCCWTGVKHSGTPEGRIELLGGLNTYVAEPPADHAPKFSCSSQTSWVTVQAVARLFRLVWIYRARTRLLLWYIHSGHARGP
ncbi:hypothetical protein L210DRAFT_2510011 [Boletus edulis BED1]|uniref:Uncharacterized protein n=1 Tax=Boletus edulis BED1 TaxID=1328754 RepID=A0AAD4BNR7_BOLED|nr:hypothetical protein L210DRAFT_2510011 [Boletus edulis BED1]